MILEALCWWAAVVWLLIALTMTANLILIPRLQDCQVKAKNDWPKVSIVVPARNEEHRIETTVRRLCAQDYPSFEVIVVDDDSSDGTSDILEVLRAEYPQLQILSSRPLPDGWLGKPNALETGRLEATGEWLLFVDADVHYEPDTLRLAIGLALEHDRDFVCLLPRLETRSVLEATVLSSLYFMGCAALPTFVTRFFDVPGLAVGSGTGNLVRVEMVDRVGAFTSLCNEVVDDVGLAQLTVAQGAKHMAVQAQSHIKVRMYDGFMATVRGFTKNIYAFFHKNPYLLFVPIVGGVWFSFLPYVGAAALALEGGISIPAVLALLLMHGVFAAIAVVFRQHPGIIMLNPLRELLWWWILARSALHSHRRGILWRGRSFELDSISRSNWR